MAVILYKKGTGKAAKFQPDGIHDILGTGNWFTSPEEAQGEEKVQEELGTVDVPAEHAPEMTEEDVRDAAKEAGISNYWNRKVDSLVSELKALKLK